MNDLNGLNKIVKVEEFVGKALGVIWKVSVIALMIAMTAKIIFLMF